jgi:calcineurin-like phosphoesterase family protein
VGRAFLVAIVVFLVWTGPAAATGILALGDFGVGGTAERDMGAAMRIYEASHPAAVLVTLGDNDYTESPTAFHSNWVASFGWLRTAGVSVTGTLGNHDVRVNGGRYEFDELNMPRAFYKRSIGNVQFFILNSNNVNATQTTWLENALSTSTALWKIVVYHHPAWTCGAYRSNAAVVRNWVPLFEKYGVNLVLSGHDHNYQRFAPRNGVRYVVHGGGGQHLYPVQPCPAGYPRRFFGRAVHGFLYLWTSDTALHGLSVTRARRVIDRFVIYP